MGDTEKSDESDCSPPYIIPVLDNIKRKSRLGRRGKSLFSSVSTPSSKLGCNVQKCESTPTIQNETKANQYLKFWNELDINKITDSQGFINISKLQSTVLDKKFKNDTGFLNENLIFKTGSSDELKTSFSFPLIEESDYALNSNFQNNKLEVSSTDSQAFNISKPLVNTSSLQSTVSDIKLKSDISITNGNENVSFKTGLLDELKTTFSCPVIDKPEHGSLQNNKLLECPNGSKAFQFSITNPSLESNILDKKFRDDTNLINDYENDSVKKTELPAELKTHSFSVIEKSDCFNRNSQCNKLEVSINDSQVSNISKHSVNTASLLSTVLDTKFTSNGSLNNGNENAPIKTESPDKAKTNFSSAIIEQSDLQYNKSHLFSTNSQATTLSSHLLHSTAPNKKFKSDISLNNGNEEVLLKTVGSHESNVKSNNVISSVHTDDKSIPVGCDPLKDIEDKFKFERPQIPILKSVPQCIVVQGVSYQVLNELGRGGSSKVYQVLHPSTNRLLAIKKVDLSNLDDMISDAYLNEVKLLSSLQHCDSVIKMFDSELVTKNRKRLLYVVMEKGDTDLSKLIREVNKTTKISTSMIAHYWSEMLKAVEQIHESGIIHSDLKPANFLLVSGCLKLIDFGIASKIHGDMTSVHKEFATGTWNYMSPEALKNTNSATNATVYKITYKSDVWSLGCILYTLVYGRTPFQHITHTLAKLQAIVDPNIKINFPDKEVPPVLMSALKSCLQKEPQLRPTVCQLLNEITLSFKYLGCQMGK